MRVGGLTQDHCVINSFDTRGIGHRDSSGLAQGHTATGHVFCLLFPLLLCMGVGRTPVPNLGPGSHVPSQRLTPIIQSRVYPSALVTYTQVCHRPLPPGGLPSSLGWLPWGAEGVGPSGPAGPWRVKGPGGGEGASAGTIPCFLSACGSYSQARVAMRKAPGDLSSEH